MKSISEVFDYITGLAVNTPTINSFIDGDIITSAGKKNFDTPVLIATLDTSTTNGVVYVSVRLTVLETIKTDRSNLRLAQDAAIVGLQEITGQMIKDDVLTNSNLTTLELEEVSGVDQLLTGFAVVIPIKTGIVLCNG